MRRILTAAAFLALTSAAFADVPNPPPTPKAPPNPADQVSCQRELLTWAVAALDDPENSRKNYVSKTLGLANCANGTALMPSVPEAPKHIPPADPK